MDTVGLCTICGKQGEFIYADTMVSAELREVWGLTDELVEAFNRKESLFCSHCGSSLRIRRLCRVLIETFLSQYGEQAENVSIADLMENDDFLKLRIAEINTCGALHTAIRTHPGLYYSEYRADAKKGEVLDGIRIEDLQDLSYEENFFDFILTSETLEHVPEPELAWREIQRVLKPGGFHIFTLPVIPYRRKTISRAQLVNGQVEHLLPPAYHGEWEQQDMFVFTDFGMDIGDQLNELGLETDVYFLAPQDENDVGVVFRSQKAGSDASLLSGRSSQMVEYTGERYLPWIDNAQAGYEHLHRYAFVLPFARGKRVLDFASGEGYGAALLAEVADRVVGVDIDAEIVKHASSRYPRANLQFRAGSILDVPIEEKFDLIVCFEAIEHVTEQSQVLDEAKRLLRKDGFLIISTPNTLIFSADEEWSWHTKELFYNEFEELIKAKFKNVFFLGQRIFSGSSIWPLAGRAGGPKAANEFTITNLENEFVQTDPHQKVPVFFVAVASDSKLDRISSNLRRWHYLVDVSSRLLEEKDTKIKQLEDGNELLDGLLKEKETYLSQKLEELDHLYQAYETRIQERDKARQDSETLEHMVEEKEADLKKTIKDLNRAIERVRYMEYIAHEQEEKLGQAEEKKTQQQEHIQELAGVIEGLQEVLIESETENQELAAKIEKLNAFIEHKERDLATANTYHDNLLREFKERLFRFETYLEQKERDLVTAHEYIEKQGRDFEWRTSKLENFIAQKHHDMVVANEFIEDLQRSLGWKLLIRVRAFIEKIAPAGSRRRELFGGTTRRIKRIPRDGMRILFTRHLPAEPALAEVTAERIAQALQEELVDEEVRAIEELPAKDVTLIARGAVCTVTSKNYLGFLRVFARSVLLHNPGMKIYVCLVDKVGDDFEPQDEPFELILMENLDNIPNPHHFFFKYSALELNTAVKPYFFEHLFRTREIEKLAFFDPDIQFYDSLDELWRLLEGHSLILTPHITDPYQDDRWPTELEINRAGIYNLGFLGMSNCPETLEFLRWWQQKLYDLCIMDHDAGMHVDQKWVNFAPAMIPNVYILRDPAYNIAYWNLHSRWEKLSYESKRLKFNGRNVVFFHFSGFDPDDIEQVSKHQNRFTLKELPNLQSLFKDYQTLILTSGQEEAKDWPYAYDKFDNGQPIPYYARKMYRDLGPKAFRFGDPFATQGPNSFFAWVNQPVDGDVSEHSPLITKLHWEIYQSRDDLKNTFPDPLGVDRERYRSWLDASLEREYGLGREFLPAGARTLDPTSDKIQIMKPRPRFSKRLYRPLREKLKEPVKRTFRKYPGILHRLRRIDQQVMVGPERDVSVRSSRTGWRSPRPFGVNVAGYISGEFGVAEVARGSIRALQAVGIAHILNNVETEVHRHADPTFTEVSPTNPYRINLVHVNADQAHEFYRQKGWEYFQDRQTIATWFWELSDFPEKWHDSFRYYQEIWVASPFCQQSIAKASPIPVIHMTFPVLVDDQEAQRDRTHFSLPEDTFIYLFHFDFLSIFERKNPLALIEAFRLAFEDRTDALLVIKTINSDGSPEQRAHLQDAAQGMNVHFIDGHINRAEMLRLMASSDSFVSLHRSEGLGLGMARSMYLGKPVIATGYSGNMAFMNQNNSFPVRYRLVELERDYGPYEQGMVWADPDIEHAAEFMQMVYQNRTLAEERAARGAEDIKKQMSPEAAGREMVTRLRLIAGFSP